MKLLFTPAIALMNRMGYKKKFALMLAISLVAISVVVYSLFVSLSQVIRASQQEVEGIALIKTISRFVQLAQQHRGIWVMYSAGKETLKAEYAAKENEAAVAFSTMEEKLPPRLKEAEDWQNIKTSWEHLEKEEANLTAADNFAIHTRLIEQIQSFEVAVADQYKLTLDSQIDTYYLIDTTINKLPDALEHLGQLRAHGTGILAKRQVTEPEKIILYGILAKLHDSLTPLNANLEKTGRYNPAINSSLSAVSKDIADSAGQVAGLVKSDILAGHFATPPEDYYRMLSMAIDRGYAQMYESLLPTTEALLKARIAQAENTLRTSIGLALLLILAVAYFSIGIYYATIGSIQALARSSRAFAGGNLRERIKLGARDELAQVGDSFNEMADGFNAMLAAHKQLEESRMRLAAILEMSPDFISTLNPDGQVTYINRAGREMLGIGAAEEIGFQMARLHPKWATDLIFNHGLPAAVADGIWHGETALAGENGSEIPVLQVILAHKTESGNVEYFSTIMRDISFLKQREKELQQSNTVLQALNRELEETHNRLSQSERVLNEAQQLAHIGSWERDLMTGSLTCSEEILRIFEIDHAHQGVSYETFILTVHPEDREMVDRAYMECIQARKPFDIVHRLLLANGRVKWVNEHGTFHYDSNGVPLRSIGTIQDITERKLADDALRVAAIAFETHEAITITDKHGNIIRVNHAFQDITGYSQEEVLGKNPRILSSGRQDKAFYAAMWQQLLDSGSWTGELWNRRKDGQIYPERLTIAAVKNGRGETTEYVAIFSDITESKQVEEKLHKYNEELEAINHQLQDTQNQLLQSEKMSSIGQLAAGVAHEINNPIGYVHSNLGTLEKYVRDAFSMIDSYEQAEGAIADEEVRTRLQAARKKLDIDFLKEDLHALMNESKDGITRVKQIVQNLKDFSHVDASDEWHFYDLHNGLDSTLNIVNNEIKYKASVIKEYGALPEVECLHSQLNQVFMNLLVNAAHAIEERGTITIRTGSREDEVWVEIADTGKGIAPENMKKIFDPFFTTKPIGKGTGLGLSLSYGIIQKHHGRIEVRSEIGKGTTFRVWLPVKQPQEEQA